MLTFDIHTDMLKESQSINCCTDDDNDTMTQCSAASLLKTKRHKRQTGNNLAKKNQLDYSLWVGCFILPCVYPAVSSPVGIMGSIIIIIIIHCVVVCLI